MRARVGRTPPPWTLKLRELLADGEWHDVDDLVREAFSLVPPSTAITYYREKVAPMRSERTSPSVLRRQIRDGQWAICRRVLTDWAGQRTVEFDSPATPRRGVQRARPKPRRVRWVRPAVDVNPRGARGRFVSPAGPDGGRNRTGKPAALPSDQGARGDSMLPEIPPLRR